MAADVNTATRLTSLEAACPSADLAKDRASATVEHPNVSSAAAALTIESGKELRATSSDAV